MDPHTGGSLAWLAQGAASNLLDRLVDRALDGPPLMPAWPPRPGGSAPGTVEISVRHQLTIRTRTPVILTLQEAGSRTGKVFSVVLGHTTRVNLPGGDYFGAAMIVDPLARKRSGQTLQGIGWSRLTVTARRTSPLVIPAHHPTAPVILQLGLRKADGTPLFRLPPSRL